MVSSALESATSRASVSVFERKLTKSHGWTTGSIFIRSEILPVFDSRLIDRVHGIPGIGRIPSPGF
jgi:hypothetical protein